MIKIKWTWLFVNVLKGYSGLALTPFVFYKDQSLYSDDYINKFWIHEKIHIRQTYETLYLNFLLYPLFYLIDRFRGCSAYEAYKYNPFEEEAWKNEGDNSYLKNRSFWAWIKYV